MDHAKVHAGLLRLRIVYREYDALVKTSSVIAARPLPVPTQSGKASPGTAVSKPDQTLEAVGRAALAWFGPTGDVIAATLSEQSERDELSQFGLPIRSRERESRGVACPRRRLIRKVIEN